MRNSTGTQPKTENNPVLAEISAVLATPINTCEQSVIIAPSGEMFYQTISRGSSVKEYNKGHI